MYPNSNGPPNSYRGRVPYHLPNRPPPSTYPRYSQGSSTLPPRTRPEDAQPSEAVTSNRRPSAPPPVSTAPQPTLAGGWGSSTTNGGRIGDRRHEGNYSRGPPPSMIRPSYRPRPPTTAGGWSSSSNSLPLDSTTASTPRGFHRSDQGGAGGGKGKESDRGYPPRSSVPIAFPTAVPVPFNPRPKLYVTQLPPSVTEEEVRSVFAPFGKIESVTINTRPSTNHAFAHVLFTETASASEAITSLHLQPFPSVNGIGPSRPIRVEYASASRATPSNTNGTLARNPVVTTEAPTLETPGEMQKRLFRERETPEHSQGQRVKKEIESPVKPSGQAIAGTEVADGRTSGHEKGKDPSSSPLSSLPSSPPPPRATAPPKPSGKTSVPPFITPPPLSFGSLTFEPTRLGVLVSSPLRKPHENPRLYSVSYHTSMRLVREAAKSESESAITKWINGEITRRTGPSRCFIRGSISRTPEERVETHGDGASRSDRDDEILTFILEVTKKGIGAIGRYHDWTEEERELNSRQVIKMRRELRQKLEEVEGRDATTAALLPGEGIESIPTPGDEGRQKYQFIEPPAISIQGLPFAPLQVGRRNGAHGAATYTLRYLYPLDLFPSSPRLQTSELEQGVRDRLRGSGMIVVSFDAESSVGVDETNSTRLAREASDGLLELSAKFISDSLIGMYGRSTEWTEKERKRNMEKAWNRMRRMAQNRRLAPKRGERDGERRPDHRLLPNPEGLQPDGTIIERILLPPAVVGAGTDQLRQQTLLRVEEVKRRSLEGKVVLSSSIDGDCITINYFVEPSDPPPPPAITPSTTAAPVAPQASSQVTSNPKWFVAREPEAIIAAPVDVKPDVSDDGEQDMEIDELASVTPEPSSSEIVKFPLGILRNSRADSVETYEVATAFIDEYFRRFDSSRSTLEGLYTPNAFFSLKVDTVVPRRLHTTATLFSRQWFESANKFASTPTAITNAIRRLPAGSHNLNEMLFNARAIPEFHLKKRDRAPILLHLTGEFEEFPDKIVRRFERSFVLVPGGNSVDSTATSTKFIIHSDQLLIGHKVEGEPRDLQVTERPFEPSSRSTLSGRSSRGPPEIALSSSGGAATTSGPLDSAPIGTDRLQSAPTSPAFSPPPIHQNRPQEQSQVHHRPQVLNSALGTPPTDARTSEKRPRSAGPVEDASANRSVPTGSPLNPQSATGPTDAAVASTGRRLSSSEVLVLSDTESAFSRQLNSEPPAPDTEEGENTPSMSPEVERPAKRPHLSRRRSSETGKSANSRNPGETSSVSAPYQTSLSATDNAGLYTTTTATQAHRSSASRGKRNAPASEMQPQLAPARSSPVAVDTRLAQTLPEEIQRFIAEEVAREVQEKMRSASGRIEDHAGRESVVGEKDGKGKDKEDDKSRGKKRKAKEKKERLPQGLGTGLSPGDSRIVIGGLGHSILHGFDGRSNKLRGMVQTADAKSFLSVSFLGDVAEWSMQPLNSMTASSITKLYSSTQDKNRVDDFTYNHAKDTLLVAYLGAKDGKEMASPPNQVVLFKREVDGTETKLVETRLTEAPHVNGGVTAITSLPNKVSTGRLRFVTGGEDKKIYLWTRQRSTQEVKLEKFRTEHTSMITSLDYLEAKGELISGGKDRRVVLFDLERRESTWNATLSSAVMSVSSVLCDPNLILSRLSTPSNQFLLHDRRISAVSPPVATFGYDLPPHRSTNGTLLPTNMGRYPRGDQMDTVVVFPDHDQGVKLWDLRQLKSDIVKKQDLTGLGRSKVVQASFKGRNELCLMELAHFTRLSIKG